MRTSFQHLVHALRMFRREPFFTAAVVLVLTLGIGAVTAAVSLTNAFLYRQWQVPAPESVAVIQARPANEPFGAISIAEYRWLRDRARTTTHMAAYHRAPRNLRIEDGSGREVAASVGFVNADYFRALGIGMTAGRAFIADEEDYRAPVPVAVLSERLWRTQFSREAAIVGRTIQIGQQPFLVVGIAERGFEGVEERQWRTDIWLPLPALAVVGEPLPLTAFSDPRGEPLYVLAGRLREGATREAAAVELSALSAEFRAAAGRLSNGMLVTSTRMTDMAADTIPPGQSRTYTLLIVAALLVLLLACANAGNLLLARGIARQRDVAVRLSLGASRARIVRAFLIEALALALVAGAIGLGFAFLAPKVMFRAGFTMGGLDGFVRIVGNADRLRESFYSPDTPIFALSLALAVVTTVVAGLTPALHATRVDVAAVGARRHGPTTAVSRLRFALLTVQIALSVVFLAGAGLLTRAVWGDSRIDPGFPIDNLQVLSIHMPDGKVVPQWKAFFPELRETLRRADLPSIALSNLPPFADVNAIMVARLPEDGPGITRQVLLRRVTANYFAVLGIPMIAGRSPDEASASREIVVSESAARRLWPGQAAIGKVLDNFVSLTQTERLEVVGIARDLPVRTMSGSDPVVYAYAAGAPAPALYVRTGSPDTIARVRSIAAALEPNVVVSARSYESYMRDALGMAAVSGDLAWAIGGLGLVLAAVGAFGVFAYSVEHRRREIGVRLALGARTQQIAALLFRSAGTALLIGLAGGFVLSVFAAPFLRTLLFGLSPLDAIAWLQVAAIVGAAVALATWIPFRRAAGVDPATTLREE